MTTTYHDNIAVGAAANAATFNAPLGDLDDAIGDVNTRIDNLILSDGASDAEVVDSRNGYTVLDQRLDDLAPVTKTLFVDAGFHGASGAKRFTTISAAISACTGGETIYIAPGTYTEDVMIADHNVKLIGSGAPSYDGGTGRLVNGTIIRGRINRSSYVGLLIRDLGVDLVGVNSTDCISGSTLGTATYSRFENLVLLGNGNAALAHGIYGAGSYNIINNVSIRNCYHGIAIHGSYNNLSNIQLYSCSGSAIVVKGKSAINCIHNNIANVTIEGDPGSNSTRSGPLAIQVEDSCEVRDVNIANVTARYCVNGVVQMTRNDATGTISEVAFANITSDHNLDLAIVGDYWIKSGDNIILSNCRSTNRSAGYAFRRDASDNVGDIYLYSSYADATGSGAVSGSFKVQEVNGDVVTLATVQPQFLKLTHGGTITIASGAITPTASFHYVDTEAAAATDDLDTINGGSTGAIIILQSASSSRDVTIKNGTGNIDCGADITLTGNRDAIMFIYGNGNRWERLSFGDNI